MFGTARTSQRINAACRFLIGVAMLNLALASNALAGTVHVDRAVLLLRGACGLDNANLDLSKGNDGRLYLQLSVGGTPRARTSLVHSDVERFTDITLKLQNEQSLAASACMGQAVNQIIGTLLSLPPEVASLPLNAAVASSSEGGGYVPPMLAQASPANVQPPQPETVAATISPSAAPNTAQPPGLGSLGELVVSIQACNDSRGQVFCEMKVQNRSPNDYQLVLQHGLSVLYDPEGGVFRAAEVRMGNQGAYDYQGAARLKIIADTAPIVRLRFSKVPDTVKEIKRLEVTAAVDTSDGTKLQKLTASNLPIQGR